MPEGKNEGWTCRAFDKGSEDADLLLVRNEPVCRVGHGRMKGRRRKWQWEEGGIPWCWQKCVRPLWQVPMRNAVDLAFVVQRAALARFLF